MSIVESSSSLNLNSLQLPPLPIQRPLLLIGHGTKDVEGRQNFLDLAKLYQSIDPCRPVIPCFLELTNPSIIEGIEYCISEGYSDFSVLPILLFAARHNKFDVTNELDRSKQLYPQIKFHYGRHFGIAPEIIQLWRDRLAELDKLLHNPHQIPRSETVLLFVGRGSSDPDANSDVYKMARLIWEGSGYQTVETCFIGITHPRLEEGFRRARLYEPKRIIVLPYFLFTGVLVKKIYNITAQQQENFPNIAISSLEEIGIAPQVFQILRRREIETQLDTVQMNCEMCKFRLNALEQGNIEENHHNHSHNHSHNHHHHHHQHDAPPSPYENLEEYHDRIWQVP